MTMEPMVLSVKDAAAFVCLSKSRLYELIAEGVIDARKLGSRTVVPVAGLRAFIENSPKVFS